MGVLPRSDQRHGPASRLLVQAGPELVTCDLTSLDDYGRAVGDDAHHGLVGVGRIEAHHDDGIGAELRRVLKGGGRLAIQDVVQGLEL